MGSGKSTLGKKLARKMELDFFDLDETIERKSGQSISNIFENLGENAFRKIENECLLETLKSNNFILATGGGTPCFFDNLKLMNEKGISIYLKMDAGMLIHRNKNSKVERPLIKGKSRNELADFIKKNLKEREIYYLRATHIVDIVHTKMNDIVRLLSL